MADFVGVLEVFLLSSENALSAAAIDTQQRDAQRTQRRVRCTFPWLINRNQQIVGEQFDNILGGNL